MKQSVKIIFSCLIALLSFVSMNAQDVIHRKNGKTLEVKILEIGDVEIRYKLFTQPDGVTFVMDASLITKVVMANGTVHKFNEGGSIVNPEYYEGQNKNAYKVSFLSWAAGYTTLTYEHSLKPGASYEAKLGIIGLGRNEKLYNGTGNSTVSQKGVTLGFGYKFIHKPDFYSARQRYAHLLKGGYIRPEVNISSYGENTYKYTYTGTNTTYTTQRAKTFVGSLLLSFGKQYIFDNKFLIDFSVGVGTGFANHTNPNTISIGGVIDQSSTYTSHYGNTVLPNNMALSMGLNIGLLGK